MKSSIKFDVNHLDSGLMYPVINLSLVDSDDPRDAIAKSFIESLGYESSWLKITRNADSFPNTDGTVKYLDGGVKYLITPEKDLGKLIYEAMNSILSCRQAITKDEAALLSFAQELAKEPEKEWMWNLNTGKKYNVDVDCEIKDNYACLEALDIPNIPKQKGFSEYTASHSLDEIVPFYRKQDVDAAYIEAKRNNPNIPEAELEFIPKQTNGKVIRISFTKNNTFYDLQGDDNVVYHNIVGHHVSNKDGMKIGGKELLLEGADLKPDYVSLKAQ